MKKKINPYPIIHPTTIALVGTKSGDKVNFSTIADIGVAGLSPALIMISLNEKHCTTKFLDETGVCSINIPGESMMYNVDYCGVVSGNDEDKSTLFEYTMTDRVPLINEAPISLIAKVQHRHQIQQRVIFILEVTATFIEDEFITEDSYNFKNLRTISYGLDNNYYMHGEKIGEGYDSFKKR